MTTNNILRMEPPIYLHHPTAGLNRQTMACRWFPPSTGQTRRR